MFHILSIIYLVLLLLLFSLYFLLNWMPTIVTLIHVCLMVKLLCYLCWILECQSIYFLQIIFNCRFRALKQTSRIWPWKYDHWMDGLQLWVPITFHNFFCLLICSRVLIHLHHFLFHPISTNFSFIYLFFSYHITHHISQIYLFFS